MVLTLMQGLTIVTMDQTRTHYMHDPPLFMHALRVTGCCGSTRIAMDPQMR